MGDKSGIEWTDATWNPVRGCQIVSTEWFREARGFNERYRVWGSEDHDLTFRAQLAGHKIVWMDPGRLLHQWHLKSVSEHWRMENQAQYEKFLSNPSIVANDDRWGFFTEREDQ